MQLSYRKISVNMYTSLRIYKGLGAKFLLESASLQHAKGRFSILVRGINFSLSKELDSYFLHLPGQSKKYDLSNLSSANLPNEFSSLESKIQKLEKLDFLSLASLLRELYPEVPEELGEIPLPLGGLGFLGYEFFNECERVSFSKPSLYERFSDYCVPDCLLVFPREIIVFDHYYDEACVAVCGNDSKCLLEGLLGEIEACSTSQTPMLTTGENLDSIVVHDDGQEWYEGTVEKIKNDIYRGDLLQAVLSRAMVIKSNLNPLHVYERLRRLNPSPYMYHLDFGEFCITGASPELFLRCKQGKQILRPIAGTRPRGASLEEDRALEKELKEDPKENAEHLMLIDLARNDIGKTASLGSVKLQECKIIERYSSVMHLVSQVEGEIAADKTPNDCLLACFPAGTVSGAPKIEAIKRLEAYENHKRGVYAGALVYFDRRGDFDSAIALRSALYARGHYYLQVGAGIVMDSKPRAEYHETCSKIESLYSIIMKG